MTGKQTATRFINLGIFSRKRKRGSSPFRRI